jgi:hypothetical protein
VAQPACGALDERPVRLVDVEAVHGWSPAPRRVGLSGEADAG